MSGLKVHDAVLNSGVFDEFDDAFGDVYELQTFLGLELNDAVLDLWLLADSFHREEGFNHSVLP